MFSLNKLNSSIFFEINKKILHDFCDKHNLKIELERQKSDSIMLLSKKASGERVSIDIYFQKLNDVVINVYLQKFSFENKNMKHMEKVIFQGKLNHKNLYAVLDDAVNTLNASTESDCQKTIDFPNWNKFKTKKEWELIYDEDLLTLI